MEVEKIVCEKCKNDKFYASLISDRGQFVILRCTECGEEQPWYGGG